jgi:glycosyltransferase involved in cell wall biosynthesis
VIKAAGLSQFDNTKFSFYRNLRWLILLRELYYIPFSLIALWRLKKLGIKFDLIHVNEITLLPVGIMAKLIFKLPVIFHVRSLQRKNNNDIRTVTVFKLLKKYADAVVCIDQTVKGSIPDWVESYVVHNGINIGEADPLRRQRVTSHKLTIGIAGVLLRAKGVYEFVEAAKILLIDRGCDLEFVIAGQNARQTKGVIGWIYRKLGFSEDVFSNVKKYIDNNELAERVRLIGLVKDIRKMYQSLDILCFPSYLNACGRPVFEAALYEIPSIVAIKEPLEDAIIHDVTGLVIDEPDPQKLADAIEVLAKNSEMRIRLGKKAKRWAERFFLVEVNAKHVLEIYRKTIKNVC